MAREINRDKHKLVQITTLNNNNNNKIPHTKLISASSGNWHASI